MTSLIVRRLALVLIVMTCVVLPLGAQSQGASSQGPASQPVPSQPGRAQIALFEPAGQRADTTLSAVLKTVADSVELDLACLQRYEVKRLPAVDPAREIEKVRAYCRANRIDQAIMGSGSINPEGGYALKLVLYDRQSDSIKLSRDAAANGALDMFDATDALVAAMLDGLSGEHVLFGSLAVETEPPEAVVSVNGMEVGPAPLSLRGLPVGAVTISARLPGHEDAEVTVRVEDEQTTSATVRLARSMGTLALNIPDDAYVRVRGADIGEKVLWSASSEELPTGTYTVEAACPGLASVSGEVAIQRDATSRWTPWARGYLEVKTDLADARVIVDGLERGAAPLVVGVDPEVLHKVELLKEKYQPYRADLSVAAARKVTFETGLTAKPGSVRVETNPPGMTVRLDDGEMLQTPCTFQGVEAGPHSLKTWDLLFDRRMYVSPGTVPVDVNPDEQTMITQQLVPGFARLAIADAPRGSSVTVDGVPLDPAAAFGPGAEVPAGDFDVVVTSAQGQVWKKTVFVANGGTVRQPLEGTVAVLPIRQVKVDGKTDDWAGLEPLWQGVRERGSSYWFQPPTSPTDPFPHQPGTRLANAWICRDDENLYIRMDFDNGTPGLNLTGDIKSGLMREVQCILAGNKFLIFQVGSNRQWGTLDKMIIWDNSAKRSSELGVFSAYAMAGSTLEFSVPLSRVRSYLTAGPLDVYVDIVDAGDGGWLSGYSTYHRMVDFLGGTAGQGTQGAQTR